MSGSLPQSVFGRLGGYDNVNDANRLSLDPVMRWIVGDHPVKKQANRGHPARATRIHALYFCLEKMHKTTSGGRALYSSLPRNWLHQAVTYMDKGERAFRLTVELAEFALVWAVLRLIVSLDAGFTWAYPVLAALVVHTFNWITNGNIWALLLFSFPSLLNKGEAETCAYLNAMGARLEGERSVAGLAIFGSAARSEWHNRSDIDMRIVRRPGTLNLIRAASVTVRERWLALLARQPLDLYLADDVAFLRLMRADEPPIFLIKRDPSLEKEYPGNEPVILRSLRAKPRDA